MIRKAIKSTPIFKFASRNGPYNPYRYKPHIVPSNYPTTDEIKHIASRFYTDAPTPLRNVRHINPVRQSGPLPIYDGPHTMEDIRNIWFNTTCGRGGRYQPAMDPEEIMRRVPGITRREVEQILTLGLSPPEQVDFAYIAYNIGLDLFYDGNQAYVARQVVTNSKGEKVEIMWNNAVSEDLALLSVGFAPVQETVDYHWEIFLWSDPMIKPTGELDLGVPNTWFEYEQECINSNYNVKGAGEVCCIEDQFNLPEDIRPFPDTKHPNCDSALWKSQDSYQEQNEMEDESWFPEGTKYNIYEQPTYKSTRPNTAMLKNK